jgi:hypothetical protein
MWTWHHIIADFNGLVLTRESETLGFAHIPRYAIRLTMTDGGEVSVHEYETDYREARSRAESLAALCGVNLTEAMSPSSVVARERWMAIDRSGGPARRRAGVVILSTGLVFLVVCLAALFSGRGGRASAVFACMSGALASSGGWLVVRRSRLLFRRDTRKTIETDEPFGGVVVRPLDEFRCMTVAHDSTKDGSRYSISLRHKNGSDLRVLECEDSVEACLVARELATSLGTRVYRRTRARC